MTTYLHDHLAGASAAVEVIEMLQKHSDEPVLVNFLNSLAIEVQEDKLALEQFMATLSIAPSVIKDTTAWVGARIAGLKLGGGKGAFKAFEALEFLALGIQGKLHLWKALERSAARERVLDNPNFELLIERAETQHRQVEDLRLSFAAIAL